MGNTTVYGNSNGKYDDNIEDSLGFWDIRFSLQISGVSQISSNLHRKPTAPSLYPLKPPLNTAYN